MTKQIKIEELIPYVNSKFKYVACDIDGTWNFFQYKPYFVKKGGWNCCRGIIYSFKNLNIAPAKDWTKSLIRIKGE